MTLDAATRDSLLAALAWQVELGADECIADAPFNRFEEAAKAVAKSSPEQAPRRAAVSARPKSPPRAAPAEDGAEAVAEANRLAAGAETLEDLHEAMKLFGGCALKQVARNSVFADGHAAARVMFIGGAPDRDEDREGRLFVGRTGQLLDRMLGAIGLDRRSDDPATAAYFTNLSPWRLVGDRVLSPEDGAMLWAFLERRIALAAPEIIVTFGNISAATMTERAVRIARERGDWKRPSRAAGRPVLMTFHPEYLLRQPQEKAKAWRDLLSLRAALDGAAPDFSS